MTALEVVGALTDLGLGAAIVFGATIYFVGLAYKKFRG